MRFLVSWSSLALLLATGTFTLAQELAPTYIKRLRLPIAQDDVGYGHSVTVDPHTGEIFVCDTRFDRLLIFDQDGWFTFQILGGVEFSGPQDIAIDPEGYLLVLGTRGRVNNSVIELDFDGVFLRSFSLAGLPPDIERLNLNSIAISPDGESLYLTDGANLKLWIVNRQGDVLRSVDLTRNADEEQTRDMVLGHVDVYGDSVLVAIPSHGEILEYDLSGRLVDQSGRKGVAPCQLGRPTAAALGETGEYLIVDQQRMVLIHWSPKENRCLGDYLGLGLREGGLYYPRDVSLDGQGRVYIAQSADGRVQVFEGMPPAAGWPQTSEDEVPDPVEPRH